MPKISTFSIPGRIVFGLFFFLFSAGLFLHPQFVSHALGQTPGSSPAANIKWKATGASRTLDAEAYSVLPDGSVYKEYGLQKITTQDYTNGKARYTVEDFQMSYKSGAFGLLSFNRARLGANRKEFLHGRHLISISSEAAITALDESLVATIKNLIVDEEGSQMPSLHLHLPEQNKVSGSDLYVLGPLALARISAFADLKNALDFTGGAEAATASYTNGAGKMELLILEHHTPQLFADAYASLQKQIEALPQNEKDRRSLSRAGNYIVYAANVEDREAAKQIISQVKFTPSIYWEGRKSSDIPFSYRPADPTALEEASETANVLLRTFYWIGVMVTSAILMGIIAGGSFFYWKRYRRRKLGVEDLFSDAGGTVRLNLDEYLLSAPEEDIKKLGPGNEKN